MTEQARKCLKSGMILKVRRITLSEIGEGSVLSAQREHASIPWQQCTVDVKVKVKENVKVKTKMESESKSEIVSGNLP